MLKGWEIEWIASLISLKRKSRSNIKVFASSPKKAVFRTAHYQTACQKELVEIDKLRKELVDIKYDALTRSSELTERTRQSRIEEYVSSGESRLQMSTTPPYVVEK